MKTVPKVLTLALAILLTCTLAAQNRLTGITLQSNGEDLEKVLDKIEKGSGYRFIFNGSVVDVHQPAGKVSADNEPVDKFLARLFHGKGIEFTIKGNKIVLSAENPSSVAVQCKVTGIVRDAAGLPLPGASVLILGTVKGTVTGSDGRFSLMVPSGAHIVFSSLGYVDKSRHVTTEADLEITLEEDLQQLDQIVVVGYGSQKRSSLTGAISTVSDKDVLRAPTMSISNIIGARVSGIAAVQSSGQPGANDATLSIRGQGSIVYIIDGIRRTAADFNGLDPGEIESVSVMKDASAVSVFGLDANGAFIVTTKKGADEAVKIDYTGSVCPLPPNSEQ